MGCSDIDAVGRAYSILVQKTEYDKDLVWKMTSLIDFRTLNSARPMTPSEGSRTPKSAPMILARFIKGRRTEQSNSQEKPSNGSDRVVDDL